MCSSDLGISLAELLRRPQVDYEQSAELDPERPVLSDVIGRNVNIEIKYEGYIRMEADRVAQFRKLESRRIPADFDYRAVSGLRIEAIQKLSAVRPDSVGQAGRISGVSPADIAVLLVAIGAERGQQPAVRSGRPSDDSEKAGQR